MQTRHNMLRYFELATQGTALVFPHADSACALLHEGSAVTAGAKYVVRTDVLYASGLGSGGRRRRGGEEF